MQRHIARVHSRAAPWPATRLGPGLTGLLLTLTLIALVSL